jgi:hypothetical protein
MKGARAARREHDLRRKEGRRAPRPTVWIICEGQRTEPNYFEGLLRSLGMNPGLVRVVPSQYGSDPLSVVRYAGGLLKQDPDIEAIWCVFDRDRHTTFDAALQRIAANRARHTRLHAATSTPCFEFWLLLHRRNASSPFRAADGCSECNEVHKALLREMPDYDKAAHDLFDRFRPGLDEAITRAQRLAADNARTGSTNPETTVHQLVLRLRELRAATTPQVHSPA